MHLSGTVLIVDDEPLIRQALSSLLVRRGFETVTAASGEEALRMARERRPDVILLNMQLPDRTGWQVHDELADIPGLADVPIIAITGFPAAISRLTALQNGFAAFLEKPFRYTDLMRTLESALTERSQRDERTGEGSDPGVSRRRGAAAAGATGKGRRSS